MTKPALFACLFLLAAPACKQMGGGGSVTLDSDDKKTLYALGLILGRNLAGFNLTPSELDVVKAGINDAALGKKAQVELETYGPKVNQLRMKRMGAKADEEKKKGSAYAEKAAQEQGAERTPSGLVFKQLTPGTGETPKTTDMVKVNYRGTLIDGTEFDSSYKRGQPATFPVNGVIKGWTEALQLMKEGSKWELFIPSDLAYGSQARPGMPPNSTLIFEVELISVHAGGEGGMPEGHGHMPSGK